MGLILDTNFVITRLRALVVHGSAKTGRTILDKLGVAFGRRAK